MAVNRYMRFLVVALLLALPSRAGAQEAVLSGVVTDSTGGVMPGVVITAVHAASGNTFTSVTDERGEYRLPARTGDYRITAALDGFGAVTREVELLVGQVVRTTFELVPSALQETVTVTGDAPILDTTQSSLSGNIDRRQMESLPVNGRDWLGLALLAPGSKATQVGETPVGELQDSGLFQIVLDGQEITQTVGTSSTLGETRVSRDAIQEFEFVSNRFDAEYGRSGLLIKAITKSGTNAFAGTLSGYFRNDAFNAADFVAKKVLPYSNQQIAGTFGGPIRENAAHFFAFYEYERQPQTWVWTNRWPSFAREYTATNTLRSGGGRFDQQFSSDTRLMIRGHVGRDFYPLSRSFPQLNHHPTASFSNRRRANQVYGTLTHVLDARTVNEIAGGWQRYHFTSDTVFGKDGPQVVLAGFFVGAARNTPRNTWQDVFSIRNNFTAHRTGAGIHDLKVGGEFLTMNTQADPQCGHCRGVIWANGGPIPADVESLFPSDDPSTWNLARLSPIVSRYEVAIGSFAWEVPAKVAAFWAQDNWRPVDALTLNLGLRSDFCTGCNAEGLEFPPLTLRETRTTQKWTVSPRLGVVYALPNDRTVIRGGGGRYYLAQQLDAAVSGSVNDAAVDVQINNDGRPNFAADPWNVGGGGRIPTTPAEALAMGLTRGYLNAIPGPDARVPYQWQTSVGLQHELAPGLAAQADYVRVDGRALLRGGFGGNVNLTCNPATGSNYPFSDVSRRAYPDWGLLPYLDNGGKSESHALQTAVTKRFSQGWQLQGTYTLSKAYNDTELNGFGSEPDNPCDLDAEWSLAVGDQRHRLVLNGIWTLPAGFELSGLYFYGSGARFDNRYGPNLRNTGGSNNLGGARLRPDGTVVPRNSFVGDPIHRVDLRLMRRFSLGGRLAVDGMVDVFNVFNHANYGNYVLIESRPDYGQPVQNVNVAYAPRMMQLGVRLAF